MALSDPSEQELFDHLIAEFGDRGLDAVAFFRTAQLLLANDADALAPRQAGAAAYCLREGLKRLLPPESEGTSWRTLSDDVLVFKKRFEAVRGLPGADEIGALEDLLKVISRVEEFKKNEQGQHQRRLAELLEARTGAPPFGIALRQYQRLLRELDSEAVHASPSWEQVREFQGRAVSVLRQVFAPFQMRQPELDSLAQLSEPGEVDAQRLLSICSTPHHLTYFMGRVVSPRWLFLLSDAILDPPAHGGIWPVLIAVERLAGSHAGEVAAWLDERYKSWGKSDVGAAYLAVAARQCLPAASRTLLGALRDYPTSLWIRGQAALGMQALDPSDTLVEKLAALLLDSNGTGSTGNFTEEATSRLLEGMRLDNADSRIDLLARSLAASAESRYLSSSANRSGSIEQVAEVEGREAGLLLHGLIAAIRRAREIELPTATVLSLLEPVPIQMRSRIRAWALYEATDVSHETRAKEIGHAVRNRRPTGDDVHLIDCVLSQAPNDLYIAEWDDAMGLPPTPEQLGRALSAHDIPKEWIRARLWYPLLPDEARSRWHIAVKLMAPDLPAPDRVDYLEPPIGLELESARSPMTRAELETLDVPAAARRISMWRPAGDSMTIARELARTLEEVVSTEPRAWAENPLATMALLRHATYVHHYFEGLTKTSIDLSGLAPRIVEAIVVSRTHPWDIVPLGQDDFDYDPTWEAADDAGVDLIGRLAARDADLGDRYDDAWAVVLAGARDRSRDSGISRREDPLETAINRPCTRALEAMFHLVGAEFRRKASVRTEALELLDEVLELEGWSGAEHRAVIVPRLQFLLHVAPEWVESHESKLFGSQAPDDLGPKSVELALKWGRPNRWLLERHVRSVRRAVRAGSENALDHLLVAMLWDIPGYSVSDVIRSLASMSAERLSKAGESLVHLVVRDTEQTYLERGVIFWEIALLETVPGTAFGGFGWWATVDGIDKERWEGMMLATCVRAEGTVDRCDAVAERCVRDPITPSGLVILATLLRGRHEPWNRSQVAEIALTALKRSSNDPSLSAARARLRDTLTDLGFFQAADL